MSKVEFLTFTDGIVIIDGKSYRYGNRTVSMQRHFAARTAGTRADKLIHIPYTEKVKAGLKVCVDGENYRIEQSQPTKKTHPACVVLTLKSYGVNPNDY